MNGNERIKFGRLSRFQTEEEFNEALKRMSEESCVTSIKEEWTQDKMFCLKLHVSLGGGINSVELDRLVKNSRMDNNDRFFISNENGKLMLTFGYVSLIK